MKIKVGLIALTLLSCINCNYAQSSGIIIKNDSLIYNMDELGNRVLDFSFCGYRNSSVAIPNVKNVIFVSWKSGDNSERIQRAIDYVASLPMAKDGFRGAVLLDDGEFILEQSLRIENSGVVLRGKNKNKTILKLNGTNRGSLIYIEGENDRVNLDTLQVVSSYVPVNNTSFQIASVAELKKGDRITISRPSTKEWIESLGCNIYGGGISALGWKPGDVDLTWDRTISSITNDGFVTIDSPISMALDSRWGDATVSPYRWTGRIADIGVENLTLISGYNTAYLNDEDHAWIGVSIDNAENCWIRNVDFRNFAGSAVAIQPLASKITVEDCIASEPISEIGGMRRQTFLTYGQQSLFQRCYSENGIHDFAVGYNAAGPNAFVQCEAVNANGFSGSVGAMAPGLLYDVVDIDGNNLTFKNLGQHKNGAGWNTANSMFWQSTASEVECYSPAKDATNRAYGCWAQFSGDGEWAESNNHIRPRSLFYAQLATRLGVQDIAYARIMPLMTNSTSSPTIEQAEIMAKEALLPRLQLVDWINSRKLEIDTLALGLLQVDRLKNKKINSSNALVDYAIKDGRITANGALLSGRKHEVPWWNGNLKNTFLPKSKIHLTRFVPGREGNGLTDRIDSVINYMVNNDILVLDHNYGLWYERRRDDHERIRRRDGDVWGPFYDQPFARSGEGIAWEGLSKYDLTRPNLWYWSRLKEFADKGAEKGLLLFHENYFQHNILEAGAHWVDSPWRSANNINETGFQEPVNFTGDKRIFTADSFYDITHPVRRELHRQYIRQGLNNFADSPNVVQLISAEYTGPLHFVEFWLDVIKEWEDETGKSVLVALSTTKDVQDAILANPYYNPMIDIIDIRYWHYNTTGLYAPEGGKNLAPRQHARKVKVGKVTYDEAYKAVSEYRSKYPDKAVTYYAQNYPDMAWAVLMAEGSCPVLPITDIKFLEAISSMKSVDTHNRNYQKMVNSDTGCIIYSHSKSIIPIQLPTGKYQLIYINPKNGERKVLDKSLIISGKYNLDTSNYPVGIYWFNRI